MLNDSKIKQCKINNQYFGQFFITIYQNQQVIIILLIR